MLDLHFLNSSLVAKLKIFMKSDFLERLEQLGPTNAFHTTRFVLCPLKSIRKYPDFLMFLGGIGKCQQQEMALWQSFLCSQHTEAAVHSCS